MDDNSKLLNKRVETDRGRGVVVGTLSDDSVIVLHDADVRLNNPIWCWSYKITQVKIIPDESIDTTQER